MYRLGAAAVLLLVAGAGQADVAPFPTFVARVMAALQPDGRVDLTPFDCQPFDPADPDFQLCRDPQTDVGFLLVRDRYDSLSVSVEVRGTADRRSAAESGAGILLPDRAAFDALRAEVAALEASSLFQGLPRCRLPEPTSETDSLRLSVLHPVSGAPFILLMGALEPDEADLLEDPPTRTELILPILLMSAPEMNCDTGEPF